MYTNTETESINMEWHHDIRPLCPCCGGNDIRKGYRYTKAKSHKLSLKAGRDKGKDKRARREARLNKLDMEFR